MSWPPRPARESRRRVVGRPGPLRQGNRDEHGPLAADRELVPLSFKRPGDGSTSLVASRHGSLAVTVDRQAALVQSLLPEGLQTEVTNNPPGQLDCPGGPGVRGFLRGGYSPPGRRLTFGSGRSFAGPVKTGLAVITTFLRFGSDPGLDAEVGHSATPGTRASGWR